MILKIIAIGILSTIAMTAFSYALSILTKNKFEEPQLLNELISRLPKVQITLPREHVLGWLLHVLVGIFFVGIYAVLYHYNIVTHSILSGGIYGFAAGLFGVLIWAISLSIHPNPPVLNRLAFYLQLVPAHVIFGITMILLYW